jgi:hypothetical protein
MYGELDGLRRLLFAAIIGAIITSISQVTFGLTNSIVATSVCFTLAAIEVLLLAQVLLKINQNLHDWFDTLERDSDEELAKEAQIKVGSNQPA